MYGFAGRSAVAALVAVAALLAVGCQELIVGKKAAQGEIDYADDLYAVAAVGESHVWAAGYFGTIVHTGDGGENWVRQNSGTQGSIYDISFADENNGWAVGRRGFIIHTSDGGKTWERQKGPRFPARHMFSVHALDANAAWIVGDWGSRYVTRDGGKNWVDESFLVDDKHPTFPYLSEEEIAAWERGDKVYDDIYLNDIHFLDAERGWIAGEYGMLFYTEDGGKTWGKGAITGTVSFDPIPFAECKGDVAREYWDYLFEVGARLVEKPYLRVRAEGFLTADELAKCGEETALADDRAVAVSDFLEGEGVSQDRIRQQNTTPFDQEAVDMDAFRASKLKDEPLAFINVIETPFLFDVKFKNAEEGLVAGLGGVILKTDDGGKTWAYTQTEADLGLYSVAATARRAWAVGERGIHRFSDDGGQTWQRLPKGETFQDQYTFFGFMRDLDFPTENRGWIVGQGGFVLRSSDGGSSWERVELVTEDLGETATGE